MGLVGPLEVTDNEGAPVQLHASRQRALLALLALRPGVVVPVERLVDELWGEAVPQQPSNALQVIVFKLRRMIGAERILTQHPGYVLAIDPDDVDAVRFERLAAEGRVLLAAGETDAAITRFDAALALWRGEPLPDVPLLETSAV